MALKNLVWFGANRRNIQSHQKQKRSVEVNLSIHSPWLASISLSIC